MEDAAKRVGAMLQAALLGVGGLSKAFYKKYGKEALPVIAEVMSRGGVGDGKMMQQMAPAKSMRAYGESFKMMGSMMGMAPEVVKLSEDVFHFKISHCPFGLEGTSRELCEAMMNYDKNHVSTFLGQEVDTKVLKTVATGDKQCEIIHSKK